jgi:type VI secretion system protein ImpC
MADTKELKESAEAQESAAREKGTLIDEMLGLAEIEPTQEGYAVTKRGLVALFLELLKPSSREERANKAKVDQMIADIDNNVGKQLDEILQHRDFQRLESAWQGLKLLVDRTDFRENNRISVLNVSKEDLLDDFEDSPEIVKSGLYKHVYTVEYGQFGGDPYGAVLANYYFDPGPKDIKLLQYAASVGAMAHAPFLAAAGPQFFGLKDFHGLPDLKDLKDIFEGPQYIKWQSLRESEDARYLGLTMPRFLLRLPYSTEANPVKGFNYDEDVSDSHENYLWGNSVFAFGTRLTNSFAKYRWCTNIAGPQAGGAVEDLLLHQYEAMGQIETKIPTEVLISLRRDFELSEEGFIPLCMRKGADNAAFFSANSVQKPKFFGISKEGR